jgi:hypothetical protein
VFEVVVVPIFEPSVIGYAVSKVTNPVPHNGVKVEVNTEEDLTKIVITQPRSMAKYPVNHGT